MLKFFGKKETQPCEPVQISAKINARLQPITRGDHFEDPLDEFLRNSTLGKVSGGGTALADEPDGIDHCDIEVSLDTISDGTINRIIETLEKLGAPKGSILHLPNGENDIPFGKSEGMAIFLNGTELPSEVYKNSDVNAVLAELDRLMQGTGKFVDFWEGSSETALYFYGSSFEEMRSMTADFVANEPLCQLARVVRIA